MGVEFDMIVKAGRVSCADTGLDGPGAIAIRDGRIVVCVLFDIGHGM